MTTTHRLLIFAQALLLSSPTWANDFPISYESETRLGESIQSRVKGWCLDANTAREDIENNISTTVKAELAPIMRTFKGLGLKAPTLKKNPKGRDTFSMTSQLTHQGIFYQIDHDKKEIRAKRSENLPCQAPQKTTRRDLEINLGLKFIGSSTFENQKCDVYSDIAAELPTRALTQAEMRFRKNLPKQTSELAADFAKDHKNLMWIRQSDGRMVKTLNKEPKGNLDVSFRKITVGPMALRKIDPALPQGYKLFVLRPARDVPPKPEVQYRLQKATPAQSEPPQNTAPVNSGSEKEELQGVTGPTLPWAKF